MRLRRRKMTHGMLRIEPAEAKSRFDDGKAVILDVVSPQPS